MMKKVSACILSCRIMTLEPVEPMGHRHEVLSWSPCSIVMEAMELLTVGRSAPDVRQWESREDQMWGREKKGFTCRMRKAALLSSGFLIGVIQRGLERSEKPVSLCARICEDFIDQAVRLVESRG